MQKSAIASLLTLCIVVQNAAAESLSQKPPLSVHGSINKPEFPAPLPPLKEPYLQSDYEQTLSASEKAWLCDTRQKFSILANANSKLMRNIAFGFSISADGEILSPIVFSRELQYEERRLLLEKIKSLSPLEPPSIAPSDQKHLMVGFNERSAMSFVRYIR